MPTLTDPDLLAALAAKVATMQGTPAEIAAALNDATVVRVRLATTDEFLEAVSPAHYAQIVVVAAGTGTTWRSSSMNSPTATPSAGSTSPSLPQARAKARRRLNAARFKRISARDSGVGTGGCDSVLPCRFVRRTASL